MDVRFPLGVFIPLVILIFSFSYAFYLGLLGVMSRINAYFWLNRASLENEDEINLYIEELKKRY